MKKLVVVGTFVTGVTVGFTACGVFVVNRVLKSDRHREGLVKVASDKMDKWLHGERKNEKYRSPKYNVEYVSYRNYHDNKYDREFIFETREKADEVLNNIIELIDTYDSASVEDVCDLCGLTPNHIDSQLGWVTTEGMKVIKTRNGYELYLPKPHIV